MPPAPARIPRRARGAGTRALTAPLHAPHAVPDGRSPKPNTPTPDCERDAHAGWVRGVGAIRGSRPRTRGAHVKRGAHVPAVYCVGSLLPSPETCGISVSRRRARSCGPTEGRGRLGGRLRPLPRPARGRLDAPPKGVDHTRGSPHHVAHIPAHPAPLSLGHQQELLDASVNEAEARSSRCWGREPATCRVWAPSVACDQHLTLWRAQRRTLTAAARSGLRARARRGRRSPVDGGRRASPARTAHAARRRPPPAACAPRPAASARRLALTLTSLLFRRSEAAPSAAACARRAGWRRSTGHEPARAAPHDHRPPGPRSRQPCARRRPGCSRRGSGTCRPRPALKGTHAPGTASGGRESTCRVAAFRALTHPSAPRARVTPNPYSPSTDPNQEPAARRAAPAACAERAEREERAMPRPARALHGGTWPPWATRGG